MPTDRGPILIVDDDPDVRESLGAVLEEEGFRVALADNGASGLRMLRDGLRPRLVLLDIMMPVLDGIEFCAEWKADSALRDIPVVIVSADGTTDEKARRCDATGWLRKPIQLEELLQLVERFSPSG